MSVPRKVKVVLWLVVAAIYVAVVIPLYWASYHVGCHNRQCAIATAGGTSLMLLTCLCMDGAILYISWFAYQRTNLKDVVCSQAKHLPKLLAITIILPVAVFFALPWLMRFMDLIAP